MVSTGRRPYFLPSLPVPSRIVFFLNAQARFRASAAALGAAVFATIACQHIPDRLLVLNQAQGRDFVFVFSVVCVFALCCFAVCVFVSVC